VPVNIIIIKFRIIFGFKCFEFGKSYKAVSSKCYLWDG
jgi:hypothetical protein